jgi:hypothetical protein
MMCGPNGIGKSSLLEAMKLWHDVNCNRLGRSGDTEYHIKGEWRGQGDWANQVSLEFHEGIVASDDLLEVMYFRTAYRHEPEFAMGQISRTPGGLEEGRPPRMIDHDESAMAGDAFSRYVAARTRIVRRFTGVSGLFGFCGARL